MTAWDLWDHRNKVLHGPDGPKAAAENLDLIRDITTEYEQGTTGLRPIDHILVQEPLSSLLLNTASSQRKWLRSVRLARQLGPEEPSGADHSQLQRQQAFMHRWLQKPYEGPLHHSG